MDEKIMKCPRSGDDGENRWDGYCSMYCRDMGEAEGVADGLRVEVARLRSRLAAYEDDRRRVLSGDCAPDEKHCTCVPALRDEIELLKSTLADNEAYGVTLMRERDEARAEVEKVNKTLKRIKANYESEIEKLCGLENETHYRCAGCDEIYERPPFSVVQITDEHTSRFCRECGR